ncbi:glutathione S-transferase U17-like [Rutidosis leptorrhynchoides]|uniref:glutathione S-transferase U17-like n=1 Tax=Rutidosis leptorrhynchoides TaxID=125765 RepID=UPI003A99BBDE
MGKECEIKLLGADASPFVMRIRVALHLKSIDYEYIHENLLNKSELLLTSNPFYKKIPVLFHANKLPICESPFILEYLDEIKPNIHPLLPSDPLVRAQSRFLANYIDYEFFPLFDELRRSRSKDGKEAAKKQMIHGLQVLEQQYVKFSRGKAYFGGDDAGYLDIILGCYVCWLIFYQDLNDFKMIDEVLTPNLIKWAKAIFSLDAFKVANPSKDALMDFYNVRQIMLP